MDDELKQEVHQMIVEAIKMHRHDGVLTQLVYLTQLFGYRVRWSDILNINELSFNLSTTTNGTTPVNFLASGTTPASFTVIGIQVTSLDTTAGNITIKNNASTVATIAKGTVAGVITGATSLANTAFTAGTTPSVVSSSAGNVFVTMQILFPSN